jgi:hypothetical protein
MATADPTIYITGLFNKYKRKNCTKPVCYANTFHNHVGGCSIFTSHMGLSPFRE